MTLDGVFDPSGAACALGAERRPFVACPSGPSGWFGGAGIVACDPERVVESCSLEEAARLLEETFDAHGPRLTVALVPFDGPAKVHVYDSGYVGGRGSWDCFGSPEPLTQRAPWTISGPALRATVSELDEAGFATRVRETQDQIATGNVYVLNLTYRVRGVPAGTPGQTYGHLASIAPAPMQALFVSPGASLASVSPERFLSVELHADGSRIARIEPVKGTAPRAGGPADSVNALDLAASAKERAEHVMIVDLERNDLGRVCVPGTVTVDPLMSIVTTPYCHQMVSTVTGALAAQTTFADLLAATFPCGSVTGAPKRSAVRYIGELESSRRGAYTGALFVAMPGRLDSSVLIRTLEYVGGAGLWGTGCGITIDSDPVAEWNESVLKTWPVTYGG